MITQIVRRALLASICLVAGLLGGCSEPRDSAMMRIDSALGSWVVVNYWAEWCKPCIKEVPELNELNTRDRVEVFGVNYDGAQGKVLKAQIDELAIAFPTLRDDPAEALGVPRPTVLPTTLVINPDGELTETLVGPQTLETLLAATIDRVSG